MDALHAGPLYTVPTNGRRHLRLRGHGPFEQLTVPVAASEKDAKTSQTEGRRGRLTPLPAVPTSGRRHLRLRGHDPVEQLTTPRATGEKDAKTS